MLNISKFNNVDNIKKLLNDINSILKIIELFLYFNKSSVATNVNRSDVSIHSCISNLREFVYVCFIYKYVKLTSNRDKYYLSLSSLLTIPQMTAQLDLIGTKYQAKNIDKQLGANVILSKIFNKTFDYINYIVLFNKFYKLFNKLENIKIFDIEININEFIQNIKKIYYYSYYQIHPTSIETDLTTLIEEVKRKINEKIDNLIAIPSSFITPEKITYLEQLKSSLTSKLEYTKSNIKDMETNIKRDFILPRDTMTFYQTNTSGEFSVNKFIDIYELFTDLNDDVMKSLYTQYNESSNPIPPINDFMRTYNNIYNFFNI